jgi:D-glycerate 3-kinase
MKLTALLDRLAVRAVDPGVLAEARVREVIAALPQDAPLDWRQLGAALAILESGMDGFESEAASRVRLLGISGGQGAGKSTLARLVVAACSVLGKKAVSLSIDDFYLTRAERTSLAAAVHPLLRTRGVPGTHDVQLAIQVLDTLIAGQPVEVPVFDKSIDDRQPRGLQLSEPVDLVVFEGWCVGAQPEAADRLSTPINELERQEDGDGVWRATVNEALTRTYPPLWSRLDTLLYLKVPDLAAVIRWRTEQEQAHPPERRMTTPEIERFVAHYERLTLWMAENMAEQADLVGFLDENHQLADLTCR